MSFEPNGAPCRKAGKVEHCILARLPENKDRDWSARDGNPTRRNTTIGVFVTNR